MTCRDRNLNATKALLLGLYAGGRAGRCWPSRGPIPTAERDEVKNVYQFNSRKLAQYIVSLAGEEWEMPTPMTVFGALNLNARNFDVELRRAGEKLENRMSGFLTQPVLSEQAVENLAARGRRWAAGPRSWRASCRWSASGTPSLWKTRSTASMWTRRSFRSSPGWIGWGRNWALPSRWRWPGKPLPYADGFYLMTPFNRVALMERLIAQLRTEVLQES